MALIMVCVGKIVSPDAFSAHETHPNLVSDKVNTSFMSWLIGVLHPIRLLLIYLGALNLSGLFASWGDGLVLCPSVLSQESGCALFAALCKEDLIYSQPMNQLTLNMSFLNLKPQETFLS